MRAVDKDEEYDLVAPNNGEVRDRLRAREVFAMLPKSVTRNKSATAPIKRPLVLPVIREMASTKPESVLI